MKMGIFPIFAGERGGGPETYERQLVDHITALEPDSQFHVYCFSQNAVNAFGIDRPNTTFYVLQPGNRWLSLPFGLPMSLKRSGVDLYHATFVPAPMSPKPYVFTMHDVSPFTRPEFYPKTIRMRLNWLVKKGLRTARLILCISEDCRQTTAELFGVSLDRMVVVHHGVNPKLSPAPQPEILERHYGIRGKYVLYVGKLEARKNIVRLIEAFSRLISETDFGGNLVLAGRRFWDLDGIDETVARCGLADRVQELGYVPDEHLSALYSGAELFVLPSLWEGFGLPVLEAMACGTPVVTSAVSSIPEVAGDAAAFVDPHSVDSIAEGMGKVMTCPRVARSMSERGIKRASEFTWAKTAKETLAAYRQALAM